MRGRAVVALLGTVVLALAGCGKGEEKKVRGQLAELLRAAGDRDKRAYCEILTTRTREAMDRIARAARDGECADLPRGTTDATRIARALTQAQNIEEMDLDRIDIDGDEAFVDHQERLPFVREGGDWHLDLLRDREVAFKLRASAACAEYARSIWDRPLPPPTRAGGFAHIRDTIALARRFRTALARAQAPPSARRDVDAARAALATVVRLLQAYERRVRAAGFTFEPTPAELKRNRRGVAATDRALTAATGRLRLYCHRDPRSTPAGRRFRREASRLCRRSERRVEQLGNDAVSGDALGRQLSGEYSRLGRRLGRLSVPAPLRPLRNASAAALRSYGGAAGAAVRTMVMRGQAGASDAELDRIFERRAGPRAFRSYAAWIALQVDACTRL